MLISTSKKKHHANSSVQHVQYYPDLPPTNLQEQVFVKAEEEIRKPSISNNIGSLAKTRPAGFTG
jgi:hypothetical protein